MYKIFDTLEQYNQFTDNGTNLTAGTLYIVKENKSLYFQTNNIDGETEKYEYLDEIPEGYIIPTGNIEITENGENINVNDYATASVNVPIPEGYIKPTGNKTITQNGTNIDVNDYATATVDVAPNLTTQNITENGTYQPSGNYDGFSSVTVAVPQPTGNISITENGENIDIAQYATATVNVAGSGGNEDLINLIERDITSITIPSGTTAIGDYAFYYCGLTSITIPDSVTSIGQSAFNYCSGLKNITIPNSVTNIGNQAFQNCRNLTSVTIPDSVTTIGNHAFNYCSGLKSITIPNGITSIGNAIFDNCSSLTSIVIPSGVTSIGQSAFNSCGLKNITIPNSVTNIGGTAFYNCLSLTSVTIGSGVTSIGDAAFYNCIKLTSITIQATTPPTLVNVSAFNNTNNCPIYVPAESLEAYKTATNWSSLSSRLQAIA